MPGLYKPTTTHTPDALFDYWLTRLSGAELRVLLYTVRRTFGWKKDQDVISLSQFLHGIRSADGRPHDEGTGIGKSTLLLALKKLSEKGLLIKTRRVDAQSGSDDASVFRLNVVDLRREAEGGFTPITTTQVPDELFDYWLPRLADRELRVLLYIVRRTLGFGKRNDVISPEQFLHGITTRSGRVLDDGCGVSRKHLYLALNTLQEHGLIAIERRQHPLRGHLPSRFGLVFNEALPFVIADDDPRRSLTDTVAHDDQPKTTPLDQAASAQGGYVRCSGGTIMTPSGGDHDLQGGEQTSSTNVDDTKGGRLRPLAGADTTLRGDETDAQGGRLRPRWGDDSDLQGERSGPQGYASQWTPQVTDAIQETERDTRVSQESVDKRDHSNLSKGPSTVAAAEPKGAATLTNRQTHPDRLAARTWEGVDSTAPMLGPRVATAIDDWSVEFHDTEHVKSNRARTLALLRQSGLGEDDFMTFLYEARRRTRKALVKRTAIARGDAPVGSRNRMPYFFAVLDDLLSDPAAFLGTVLSVQAASRDVAVSVARGVAPAATLQRPSLQPTPARDWGAVAPVAEVSVEGATALWAAVLAELHEEMTDDNYARWLAPTHAVDYSGGLLVVEVPSPFAKGWLESRLAGRVRVALERVVRRHQQEPAVATVRYIVIPSES